LRFKLAAFNLLVFGVILTALCMFVLTVREEYLRQDFDERLVDRAQTIADTIEITATDSPTPRTRLGGRQRWNPFRFPGYYFQLRSADGGVLERSQNLGHLELPLSFEAEIASQTAAPVLETIRGEMARALLGTDGELRLLTLYDNQAGARPVYLQVGVSLARVNESIADFRGLLLILLPIGLGIVGLASWLIARRSLSPIGRIAQHTRALTAAHLDRRIDLPAGHDEVAQMVMTINQMLDRLEAAFQAQERFLADASHELKTPVTVLLGEAQVLTQQERTTEEYDHFVASVQDEMRHMAKLVDSLLTLARADAGFPLARRASVSLNDIVMDAVERCQAIAQQREVRLMPMLAMPTSDTREPVLQGDAFLLRTMVENLIRNAVRYSPPEEKVDLELVADGRVAVLSVRDRGPGIPPEDLDHIFDRFYRVSRGRQSDEGAGLGLAIAKGVAQLHRGSIEACNLVDGGCNFTVRLPLLLPSK
jgi:heavy metal sensor kinase